jgi:hypothetical protein
LHIDFEHIFFGVDLIFFGVELIFFGVEHIFFGVDLIFFGVDLIFFGVEFIFFGVELIFFGVEHIFFGVEHIYSDVEHIFFDEKLTLITLITFNILKPTVNREPRTVCPPLDAGRSLRQAVEINDLFRSGLRYVLNILRRKRP